MKEEVANVRKEGKETVSLLEKNSFNNVN